MTQKEPELRTTLPRDPDPASVRARTPVVQSIAETRANALMALRETDPEAADREARRLWRTRNSDD